MLEFLKCSYNLIVDFFKSIPERLQRFADELEWVANAAKEEDSGQV